MGKNKKAHKKSNKENQVESQSETNHNHILNNSNEPEENENETNNNELNQNNTNDKENSNININNNNKSKDEIQDDSESDNKNCDLNNNNNLVANTNEKLNNEPEEKNLVNDHHMSTTKNKNFEEQNQNSFPLLNKEATTEDENIEPPSQLRKRGSSGILEAEFFKHIRSENANKLRKQILKMQNRADKYVDKFYRNSSNFQEIKKELHSRKCNNIFNSFSLFIGFNWRINLKRTNFFILAAEAWILEVFRSLQIHVETNKKIINENYDENQNENAEPLLLDYPSNFTFAAIIRKITKMRIDEQSYLFNLSVLTGSVYSQSYLSATTKLIENNIGLLFFNSLKKILAELELNEKDSFEDDELDQRKFENLLADILRKAVEKALNSMDSQASEQKTNSAYINYLQIFEKLKQELKDSSNSKNFTYKNYLRILEKENFEKFEINIDSEAISKDFSIKICAETFFDFCGFTLLLIIEDTRIFIKEYFSLHYRLKNLFGKTVTRLVDYNKKYIKFLKAIYNGIFNKLKSKLKLDSDSIDKLYEYYHKKFPKAFEVLENQKNNFTNSYKFCRNWVNSSYDLVKNSSSYILENFFYEKYKLIYASFINPISSLSLCITNNITKFVVIRISKCATCVISYKNILMRLVAIIKKLIKQVIFSFYESTIGFLRIEDKIKFLLETNDEKIIEFSESENKNYIVVKVNNKLIGNLLFKLKSLRSDLIRKTFQAYKGAFKKAFEIPKALVAFSNEKGLEVLDFLKSKFEEMIEAE